MKERNSTLHTHTSKSTRMTPPNTLLCEEVFSASPCKSLILFLTLIIVPLNVKSQLSNSMISDTMVTSDLSQAETIDSVLALPLVDIRKYILSNLNSQWETCQKLSQYALPKAYETEDNAEIGEMHRIIGNMYVTRGLVYLDSAIHHQVKAKDYLILASKNDLVARINEGLALDYLNMGELEKAQAAGLAALVYYDEEQSEEGIATASNSLSSVFLVAEDYPRSLEYAADALKYFRKEKRHNKTIILLITRVQTYLALEEYDNALKDAQECIRISQTEEGIVPYYEVVSHSLLGDVLDKKGDLDGALNIYYKYWNLSKKLKGAEASEDCRLTIGSVLSRLGKHREAIEHLEAGINVYGDQGEHLILDQIAEASNTYAALGNYEKAYAFSKKVQAAKTDALRETISNLESEAIVKYETGKKDAALAAQEAQLKQSSVIQKLYFGLAGLLTVLLCVLYYFFTKNKETTAQLAAKNQENELLLKEIHHRVKNNLQTISSLLSLQSQTITDPTALDAVQESKNRVASMGIIHQKLYQKDSFTSLEISDYFNTIGKTVIESFGTKARDIKFEVVSDKIMLDVDTAVPVGLITNELITNSLKHAFPDGNGGTIKIKFDQLGEEYNLTVSDDGQYKAATTEQSAASGFGTMLVQLLTKQLRGNLIKSTENGTAVSIRFGTQVKSLA